MKKVIFITFLSIVLLQIKAQDPKGQTVVSFIAPTDSLDEYYTHDDYFGLTATKIVKSLIERDKIPTARRREGMKVYVQSVDRWYKLYDCIGNNCWVEDRVDTLRYGTFSTGKITVQPELSDPSFLYDAYTKAGFQRFGVSKNGLLLAGRRMPAFLNVDALAWIGDRNELLATDGIAFGKDLIVDGDSSAAFGYNLHSTYYNSIVFGRGKDRQNRIKNRYPWSVNFGAFQSIPQIELTEDTIRFNSSVLWWNDAPLSAGGESYSFENGLYEENGTIRLGGELIENTSISRSAETNSASISFSRHAALDRTYLQFNNMGLSARLDESGFNYVLGLDTSLFGDNSLITKRYLLDRVNNALFSETDPIFDVSPAKNITEANISAWNSKQAALVSGSNIKTIKGQSLLGPGDITINMQYQKTLDSSLQWKKQFNREFKIYDDEDGMIYFSSQSGYSNILFTTGQSGYGAPTSDINMTRGQVYISAGPSTNNQAITLTQDGARYYKRQTMNNPSWIPDKAYTDSLTANLIPAGTSNQYVAGDKTLKDFPVKTMVVNIPNANLRTSGTGSRIELLSYMPQNSIVLGATIRFSKFESGSTRLSASIGSSATYPILILTNVEPESVGYNFIPNTTRYGGNVLYFEVTSTNITDTEMTGTLSFAYIPLGL